MANKFTDIHKPKAEQPKFAEKFPKNPSATKDPLGQQGFDKAQYDKTQAEVQKQVDGHVKASYEKQSNLKESVSKMQSTTKVQEVNRDKNITHDR